MIGVPHIRFYGNDWFTGVAGLKADERGVYISMCVYIWTIGKRVPLDDAEAARSMALNFKSYQRLRDRLVVLGKLKRHVDGYGNDRAERELAAAQEAAGGHRRAESAAALGEPGRATPDTGSRQTVAPVAEARRPILNDGTSIDPMIDPMIDHGIDRQKTQCFLRATKEPEPEKKEIEEEAAQPRAAVPAAALPDLVDLSNRLTTICNGALASQAIAPGLASMSTPRMWLEAGCDLERDVIPTLTIAGKRYHGKRIRSWDYFTAMVAEAKARREKGLPDVSIGSAGHSGFGAQPNGNSKMTMREALVRRKAQQEAASG